MKKLLVLMLVLGMASLANASYTFLTPSPNGLDYDIVITSDGADADGYWALGIDASGALSAIAIGPGAPGNSGVWGDLDDGYVASSYFPGISTGQYGAFATPGGSTRDAGTYLTAMGHPSSVPVVYLYSFNEAMSVITFEDSAELPEPMTIALLGLGGLFLRRRK